MLRWRMKEVEADGTSSDEIWTQAPGLGLETGLQAKVLKLPAVHLQPISSGLSVVRKRIVQERFHILTTGRRSFTVNYLHNCLSASVAAKQNQPPLSDCTLPMSRPCVQASTCFPSLHPHSSPVSQMLFSSYFRWGNQGLET